MKTSEFLLTRRVLETFFHNINKQKKITVELLESKIAQEIKTMALKRQLLRFVIIKDFYFVLWNCNVCRLDSRRLNMTETDSQANEAFKNSLSHSPAERLRSGSLDEHKEGRFCDGVYEYADWNVSERNWFDYFSQHWLVDLFKVSNGNTIAMCEIYSKLIIKALKRR